MYLHSQRLLKAVWLWNTVQNTASSTYSAYKELQCSQNFSKRYVMQVNLRACSNFKTRASIVEVAHIWRYFSIAVIHERNFIRSWIIHACYPHVTNSIETPQVKTCFTSLLRITSIEDWVFESLLISY